MRNYLILSYLLLFNYSAASNLPLCPSNKLKNENATKIFTDENIEYKFKSGDTIFALSVKYCIDLKELMKLNNLDDAKTIAVNTIIDIPQDRCLK